MKKKSLDSEHSSDVKKNNSSMGEEPIREEKTFDKYFMISFLLYIIFVIIILFLPYLITTRSWFNIDFSNTGQIGTTIGGILGPFIAIVAGYLTFMAFWVQYKANKQSRMDIEIDRFENKFYELIRLHRSNVEEIKIKNNITGRAAFIEIFYELRFTFYTIKKFIEQFPKGTKSVDLGFDLDDDETILKIAYAIFFLGLNENSKKSVMLHIKEYCTPFFINALFPYLESRKIAISQRNITLTKNRIFRKHRTAIQKIKFNNDLVLEYDPHGSVFEGYDSNIGHYYRHLYQAVKYVDQIKYKFLTAEQRYNYVRTLRAQLSNHEQLLLYYNTFYKFGCSWIKNGYLVKYKIIKNMPLPLADFGVLPTTKFSNEITACKEKGKDFFEWILE